MSTWFLCLISTASPEYQPIRQGWWTAPTTVRVLAVNTILLIFNHQEPAGSNFIIKSSQVGKVKINGIFHHGS